jgi:hypothetical protein
MSCSVRDIERVIARIVPSDEPAVVLSSLARAGIPAFSDACAIELSEGTEALFQVSFPLPDEDEDESEVEAVSPARGISVTTPFQASSGHGFASFAGLVMHSWAGRDAGPDDAIIARLLVDHALVILRRERMAQALARAEDRAAKLAIELMTSRPRDPARHQRLQLVPGENAPSWQR